MFHRYTYLEKDRALANSGERTVDINLRDPITCLWVEVRCANGASWNHHNPMHACVSDIEVIDGANVLYSLDGYQAYALACAQLGQAPQQKFSALGGDPQSIAVPINFGRFLGDQEYALDPKRFVNPQLRVKWNLAAVNAVGATGFADAGATLTVIADVMEGVADPRSMLMAKEVYTWTSAVGTEYIDLPVDYPYRALMYRGYLASYHPFGVISNVKLSCDAGRFVPMDVAGEDLLFLLMRTQPRLSYRISDHLKDGDTFYSYMTELEDVSMNVENSLDTVASYYNYEYGNQTVHVYVAGSASGSYINIGCHVHGYCPFGYLYVPFGRPEEPGEWFRASEFRSIRAEMLGAVASGSCALCLVQDRAY